MYIVIVFQFLAGAVKVNPYYLMKSLSKPFICLYINVYERIDQPQSPVYLYVIDCVTKTMG